MNVRRFTARTSRDALRLVREALGEDAVVLSTKPCADGVEVLAMAPDSLQQIERAAAPAPQRPAPAPVSAPAPATPAAQVAQARATLAARSAQRAQERTEPTFGGAAGQAAPAPRANPNPNPNPIAQDAEQLAMSTLSFQDYVRERMLRKREAAMKAEASKAQAEQLLAASSIDDDVARLSASTLSFQDYARQRLQKKQREAEAQANATPPRPPAAGPLSTRMAQPPAGDSTRHSPPRREVPVLHDEIPPAPTRRAEPLRAVPVHSEIHVPAFDEPAAPRHDQQHMLDELKSMKGLIEERFGALAFMEKLQRQPAQARLIQKLLECGFSPALIRKLAESLTPEHTDEIAWAAGVLERNLLTDEAQPAIEEQTGVFALIGSTGVGKTTTTAKIAAAFATKHGAAHLGLITLDAYRVGAHEQLRAYGRILGVPVHTAHDKASLEDLLELLSAKKMVLIDTAGMAQRDSRTRELLDMLSHRSIRKLLVVNASAQGETIEDVLIAYRAQQAQGVVLSKIDEAVKLGPVLDAVIRHKVPVLAVANGQRVPEDWHRLSAHALVQRALRVTPGTAYRMDTHDINLIFAAPQQQAAGDAGRTRPRG